MDERCQVDFYLLGAAAQDPGRLACRLATMAWERGHAVAIVTADESAAARLDTLLWEYPEGRFVPHARADSGAGAAPVSILTGPPPGRADVVINLTSEALPQPQSFRRVLEIVPFADSEREASRDKFRAYRRLGLAPETHEIN